MLKVLNILFSENYFSLLFYLLSISCIWWIYYSKNYQ